MRYGIILLKYLNTHSMYFVLASRELFIAVAFKSMKSDMLTFFVSVYVCLFNYAPLDKIGLEWIKAEGLLDGLEGLEVGTWTSLVVDRDTWVRFSASSWFLFSSRLGKGNILLRFFTGNEKIMNKKNMFKRTNPPLKKNKKMFY